MKILFRVDAGGQVGLGHFYRSLNLALHLQNSGHTVQFLHRPSDFWQNTPTEFVFVAESFQAGDEEAQIIDKMLLGDFDILYVDGILDFKPETIQKIQLKSKVVFYQNLSSSKHLADVFIWPAIHEKPDFFTNFSENTKIFKGLQYVMLNSRLEKLNPKIVTSNDEVKKVAIVSGGSDPQNVLLKIYSLIAHHDFPDLEFTFFYGENFLHFGQIPSETRSNCKFQKFDHAAVLKNDLLICTFGVSTYEFIHLGMPILSVGHQASNANASEVVAQKTAAICHLGLVDDLDAKKLGDALLSIVRDIQRRVSLSKLGKNVIDSQGVQRVAKILEEC